MMRAIFWERGEHPPKPRSSLHSVDWRKRLWASLESAVLILWSVWSKRTERSWRGPPACRGTEWSELSVVTEREWCLNWRRRPSRERMKEVVDHARIARRYGSASLRKVVRMDAGGIGFHPYGDTRLDGQIGAGDVSIQACDGSKLGGGPRHRPVRFESSGPPFTIRSEAQRFQARCESPGGLEGRHMTNGGTSGCAAASNGSRTCGAAERW